MATDHPDGGGSVLAELERPLREAIAAAGGEGGAGRLERPADPHHGDYASTAALGLARTLRRPPRDIAERIAGELRSPWIATAEVAGPGFLNLRMAPAWYGHVLERVLDAGPGYGAGAAQRRIRVQVEYVSGNPTGPVTVATGRNAAYGDSVARLLAFAGHDVDREYYFNDAGRQMDLFGASLRARARGEEPPEGGYQGAYVGEIAAALGLDRDAPLEQWTRRGGEAMMARIRATLERFRAHFDSWFLERSLYDSGAVAAAIERVRERGYTYERDGALWLRTTEFGDDKDRVVVRSNGLPGYIAGDLAYMVSKMTRGYDRAIYVLGADHHGYIGRLKAAAAILGYDPERVDVALYQMVHIVDGGERRKMSKRAGATVFLDELLDAIGVDAARFALVQRSHDQTIDLDLELLIAQNQENPVYYCQYAHARIAAILRNRPDAAAARPAPGYTPEPAEAELIKALADFPDLVAEAAERRAPHRVVAYTQDTAKAFHQFYKQCRVLGSPPDLERSRLALCRATQQVIATALGLVGVSAPERM